MAGNNGRSGGNVPRPNHSMEMSRNEMTSSTSRLLEVLSRLPAEVAGASDVGDVLNRGCRLLGSLERCGAAVVARRDEGRRLAVRGVSGTRRQLDQVEQVTGISWNDFRIDPANSATFDAVVRKQVTRTVPASQLASELFAPPVVSLMKKLWIQEGFSVVLTPLKVGEESGVLLVCGPRIGNVDRDVVVTCAQLLSTSMELWSIRSERDSLRNELSRESELLQALMEHIPDYIYFKDSHSRFTRINKAHAALLGLTDPSLAVGMSDFDFFPEDRSRRFYETEQELIRTGSSVIDTEEVVKNREGHDIRVSTTKVPLRDRDGTVAGIVGISRDITQRKLAEAEKVRLEEELTQAQKLESLGQLAGGVAHDFNNMLGAIMGNANMMVRKLGDNEGALKRYAQTIIEASRRASDLTAKLLAFARKGKYSMTTIDIHAVVQDVIKLLKHTLDKRIQLVQHLEADPPGVRGDRGQLQNVILNLALNARDAMPDGGTLTLSTRLQRIESEGRGKSLHLEVPGSFLELSVTDTGTGMDQQTMAHIFEPFFTTKEKGHGTGLGLASVYGTVKSHEGAIEVKSEPGAGTTFTVLLPSVAELPPEAPRIEARQPQRGTGSVLVVDDEKFIRDIASEMLGELGYNVVTCNDGVEAVEYYRTHPHCVDLAIIDMIMPRMRGAECVEELRKINPKLKVIIATGYSLASDTQRTIAQGIAGFIQKPFDDQELAALVSGVLKQP